MVSLERTTELETQLGQIGVGVINSRLMAYRVLSVLRVEPLMSADVDELDFACKKLVRQNIDQCLLEEDFEDNTGEL